MKKFTSLIVVALLALGASQVSANTADELAGTQFVEAQAFIASEFKLTVVEDDEAAEQETIFGWEFCVRDPKRCNWV